jgi:hypothetical protein
VSGESLIERVVVGVDIQASSSRNDRRGRLLQRELNRMLDDAADGAGISRKRWERRGEGDGEVAMLPADVDLLAVVRRFPSQLDQLLTDHNDDHKPETCIRLRVAMHIGGIIFPKGPLGYGGRAFEVLQRLLNSAPVRTALAEAPAANFAQIISESLYQKAVVPELGGLRPRQFKKVQVDLPDRNFHQTAYVYIPKDPYAPPASQPPPNPRNPHPGLSGFPLPMPPARPARRRSQPSASAPQTTPGKPSNTTPEPPTRPTLSPAVRKLVRGVREALAKHEIENADTLTTFALLEAAGRTRHECLRESDGRTLPDTLFTELNTAWANHSGGVWGFHAQRKRIDRPVTSAPGSFRRLSVAFGWRDHENEIAQPYADFTRRDTRNKPFYPTLRNPEREQYPAWHNEWSATVMSVHVRLQDWSRET